jgi:hypothetical protein
LLSYWYFHCWWYEWGKVAEKEHQVNIPLDMFIDVRVSNFDCNFFSFVLGLVYLTDWSWSYRYWIKLFENILYIFSIIFLEIFFCGLIRMCWCIFP